MLWLIDIAHRRARTTLTILVALIIAGVSAYNSIPKESFPDISIPVLYISLSHDGISPEDSQRLIIRPIEQELRGLEGVKEMRATAYEGGGFIQLEYDAGFDSEQALIDVREKIDRVKSDLPEDTKTPRVREVNLSLFPVVTVAIYGDAPQRLLQNIAKRTRDEIESLTNILEVKKQGVRDEVVEIIIDRVSLENYNLNPDVLIARLAKANSIVAPGGIDSGQARFGVKLQSAFESAEELRDLIVKGSGNDVVRVRDIATLRNGFKDSEQYGRINGKPAILLNVSKRTGTNMIETIDAVRAIVEQQAKDWPASIQYVIARDQSLEVRSDLNDLQNNVISAILLVVIVLLLSLGMRAGLLVGIAIPGAFLSAVLFLYLFGYTVNMVVLFALILSVGMLVDGAIVVSEYAERQLAAGMARSAAFRMAAKRMAWPIIASTATTLAAFFPLLFWPGIVGEFMLFFPITLIATLTASLAMALIFIPVLGVHLSRIGHVALILIAAAIGGALGNFLHDMLPNIPKALLIVTFVMTLAIIFYILGERVFRRQYALLAQQQNAEVKMVSDVDLVIPTSGAAYYYVQFLRFLLKAPSIVLILSGLSLFVAWGGYAKFGNGVEFFPDSEPNQFMINVNNRDNLSIDAKDKIMRQLEAIIIDYQQDNGYFKNIETLVGDSSNAVDNKPGKIGGFTIELNDWFARPTANDIIKILREKFKPIPGIMVETVVEKAGPKGSDKPINVEISAYDSALLEPSLQKFVDFMNNQQGYKDIEDSRGVPAIDWSIDFDREEATRFNIDVLKLGQIVRLVTQGQKLTSYRPETSDSEIDIRARFPSNERNLSILNDINIYVDDEQVPVRNFVDYEPVRRIDELHRAQSKRIVFVKSDVEEGVLVNEKINEIQAFIDSQQWADGLEVTIKGENEDQAESQAFLSKAFIVAITAIALILLTQFNNFFSMILILTSVIMSTVGVLMGLLITGQPFGIVMSGLGVIALAGIVVNNNIVLIDTYNILREHCKDGLQAILVTCAQRFRPVMLTTCTTILGLMPMVLQWNVDFLNQQVSIGAPSTQFWVQLATAIVFGLAFSTVLTLCVTPAALFLMDKFNIRRKNILAQSLQRTIYNEK